MDTIDYIRQKYGKPNNGKMLKGIRRNDFYHAFRELNFTVGAEIGVYRGRNARVLFDTVPGLKLHLIDPYLAVGIRTQERQNHFYRRMKQKLAVEIENGQAHIIKKWSMDAVRDFEDGSLDFVYIDANHKFDFVMQDIIFWSPKVRVGGIVAGHDYYKHKRLGIVSAVDAYVKNHKLSWYLLDDEPDHDDFRTNNTWFFVKKI